MQHGRHILLVLVVFACCATAQTAEPQPTPHELILQLADAKYATRERAERRLTAMGEQILPDLYRHVTTQDAELNSRLRTVINTLERQASTKRLLKPPTLRLQFNDVPLHEIVKRVNQQAGLNYYLNSRYDIHNHKRFTFDTGEVPFWMAVNQFLHHTQLAESHFSPVNNINYLSTGVDEDSVDENNQQSTSPECMLSYGNQRASAGLDHVFRLSVGSYDVNCEARDSTVCNSELRMHIDPLPNIHFRRVLGFEIKKIAFQRAFHITDYPISDINPLTDLINSVDSSAGVSFMERGYPYHHRHFKISLRTTQQRKFAIEQLAGNVEFEIVDPRCQVFRIDRICEPKPHKMYLVEGVDVDLYSITTRLNYTTVIRLGLTMTHESGRLLGWRMPSTTPNPFRQFFQPAAAGIDSPVQFSLKTAAGATIPVSVIQVKHMERGYQFELHVYKPKSWQGVSLMMHAPYPVSVTMPFVFNNIDSYSFHSK
jgi:hypothetical protein